jgi:hypothetical protein
MFSPHNNQKYLSYVGKPVNDVIMQMKNDYPNMSLVQCNINNFCNEIFYMDAFRALIIDGNVVDIHIG